MVGKMMYSFVTGSCEYEKVLGKSGKYHAKAKREERIKTSTTINCNVKEAWESRCGTVEVEDKSHRHFRTQAEFKHFF